MKRMLLSSAMLCMGMLLPVKAQVISFSMTEEAANQNTPDGWTAVNLPTGIPAITEANTFVITSYGASTSSTDNTSAIQAALDAAANAGGGMVVIPAGTFVSGYLTVGSKTILHLCENATLMLKDITTFPIDGNGYHEMSGKTPFITGKSGASDIVIEGESRETSILDGQGAPWWDEVETSKAAGKSTTRGPIIRFWQGQRYLFRNFRVQNAPNTNITIGNNGNGSHQTAHDITIINPSSGAADPSHNTDGFPIWTDHVNIYGCYIDTGDDNVVCDRYAQYVHVWDCDFKAGHGASFGSYTTGMHDIIYENLRLDGTDAGFRLKSNNDRSGDVYNIIFRNCTMKNVVSPISITCWYDSLPKPAWIEANAPAFTELTPRFHDILIKDVTISGYTTYSNSGKNGYGIFIYGRPESYVQDVTLENVNLTHAKGLKLNFCQGIQFKNCDIAVFNTNQTSKNGSSTEDGLPSKLIEQQYQGSYTWSYTKKKPGIISWNLGEDGAELTNGDVANAITGATGSAAAGWTVAITGNKEKNISAGNGYIEYNGNSYKTIKDSKGAQNTITLPAGEKAKKVEFYATSNPKDPDTGAGRLVEFNGVTCSEEVSSVKDYKNPTYISKSLSVPANSFTYTFKDVQVCYIAVVTLATEEDAPTAMEEVGNRTANAMRSEKILRDGQLYIIYKGILYDAQGKVVSRNAE